MNHWEHAGWNGGGCYPNVEFDPNVKGRLYLVSDVAGIWRSTASGERWSFMNQGLENSGGTASGSVFHSVDGGRSWSVLGNIKKPFDDDRPITALAGYGVECLSDFQFRLAEIWVEA